MVDSIVKMNLPMQGLCPSWRNPWRLNGDQYRVVCESIVLNLIVNVEILVSRFGGGSATG